MNFSLTFTDLQSNGSYAGAGNFIKYLPIQGKGRYNFTAMSMTRFTLRHELLMDGLAFRRLHDEPRDFRDFQTPPNADSQLYGNNNDE